MSHLPERLAAGLADRYRLERELGYPERSRGVLQVDQNLEIEALCAERAQDARIEDGNRRAYVRVAGDQYREGVAKK